MRNITVFSNRLGESNGTVENVLELKPTTTKKAPWFLRFAGKMKTMAAAIVGIALLVGSTGDVQAKYDPPIFDLCVHKFADWSSSGYFRMWIEFEGDSDERYEVVWHGLKKLFDISVGDFVLTSEDDGEKGLSGVEVGSTTIFGGMLMPAQEGMVTAFLSTKGIGILRTKLTGDLLGFETVWLARFHLILIKRPLMSI